MAFAVSPIPSITLNKLKNLTDQIASIDSFRSRSPFDVSAVKQELALVEGIEIEAKSIVKVIDAGLAQALNQLESEIKNAKKNKEEKAKMAQLISHKKELEKLRVECRHVFSGKSLRGKIAIR